MEVLQNWNCLSCEYALYKTLFSCKLFISHITQRYHIFSQQSSFARVTKVLITGSKKWASISVGVCTHLTTMSLKMRDYCKHSLSWYWHLESIGLFHNTNFDFFVPGKAQVWVTALTIAPLQFCRAKQNASIFQFTNYTCASPAMTDHIFVLEISVRNSILLSESCF